LRPFFQRLLFFLWPHAKASNTLDKIYAVAFKCTFAIVTAMAFVYYCFLIQDPWITDILIHFANGEASIGGRGAPFNNGQYYPYLVLSLFMAVSLICALHQYSKRAGKLSKPTNKRIFLLWTALCLAFPIIWSLYFLGGDLATSSGITPKRLIEIVLTGYVFAQLSVLLVKAQIILSWFFIFSQKTN
jgi:hypothetical protein